MVGVVVTVKMLRSFKAQKEKQNINFSGSLSGNFYGLLEWAGRGLSKNVTVDVVAFGIIAQKQTEHSKILTSQFVDRLWKLVTQKVMLLSSRVVHQMIAL